MKQETLPQVATSAAPQNLAVDLDQAREFIKRLTGSADTPVTFQTFPDKARDEDEEKYRERDAARKKIKRKLTLNKSGTIDELADELAQISEGGGAVCMCISETDLHGREKENVVKVRALYADWDNLEANPAEQVKALPLEPHIVVESSPGRQHAYWLTFDCGLDDFEPTQQKIIERLGTDKTIHDLSRVMRLPGFFHNKAEPFLTRIIDRSDTLAYTLAEVKAGLLPPPVVKPDNTGTKAKVKGTGTKQKHESRSVKKIRSALAAIPIVGWDERSVWLELGMALHAEGTSTDTLDDCYKLWCEYASKSKKFVEDDSCKTWTSFSEMPEGKGKTIGTLFYTAQSYGWQIPAAYRKSPFTFVESDGVYFHGFDPKTGDPAPPLRICGPLQITAEAVSVHGSAWGLVLEFEDRAGKSCTWVMSIGMLAGEAVDVRSELMTRGLWIAPGRIAREQFSIYLGSAEGLPHAVYTGAPGWCGKVFVTPSETIGSEAEQQRVIYQGGATSDLKQRGSVHEWRDHVANLAVGNSRLMFAISVAFAAPLLRMTEVDSGGFNFRGRSSEGKSSIVKAAASVWGASNYTKNWRATSNGLESIAQSRNDNLLTLDEMGQVDAKEIGACAYMLSNGAGKIRSDRSGLSARPTAQWRLLYLSTSELSLATIMLKVGQQVEAGQEVRLIELPSDAGKKRGIYETLHGRVDGAALSDEIVRQVERYHGAVGVAFLRYLTDDYDKAEAEIRDMHAAYTAALLPDTAEGQAKRAAARFALAAVGGEIATRRGLTGWPEGAAVKAAQVCFRAWLANRGGPKNAENRAILTQVRAFLEQEVSRFQVWGTTQLDRAVPRRVGFREQGDDGATHYVFPEAFKVDVCKGKDSREVARLLAERKWLHTDKKSNSRAVTIPGMGKTTRCYVFLPKAMQEDID